MSHNNRKRAAQARIGIVLVGILLLVYGALTATNVLATLIVDNTPPTISFISPSGTIPVPALLGTGGQFIVYAAIGEDNSLTSGGGTCGGPSPSNCVTIQVSYGTATPSIACPPVAPCQTAYNYGTVLYSAQWVGGVGSCTSQYSGSSCTAAAPNTNPLPGTCGTQPICAQFPVQFTPLNGALVKNWLLITVNVYDVAGNKGTSIYNGNTSFAFTDQAFGYMILQTGGVQYNFCPSVGPQPAGCIGTSGTVVTTSLIEQFEFNATQLPGSITGVTLIVTAVSPPSNAGTGTYCMVGTAAGCANPPTTSTQPPFVFSTKTQITVGNGIYNITGTFSCQGCALPSYRVLSVFGNFGTTLLPPNFNYIPYLFIGFGIVLIAAPFAGVKRKPRIR